MFDVGFSELGVIGLVALIVIGPEQLPRVARTAGHLMGRLRRYVSDVKSDISREMELADLQRISDEVKESARSLESSIREQVAGIESEVQQSIATPSMHELVENTVVQASAEYVAAEPAEAASAVEPSPSSVESDAAAEIVIDPNQMDLFGASPIPTASSDKH